MGSMDHLRALSLRASDMVQEVSSSFEEHFLWLEEVLAEARHTLASEDLLLLPKTPSAAPKRTRRIIEENGENLPYNNFASPPPTRRGRLCSKLASQKIQEQVKMSRVKKLRRPSSPLTEVHSSRGQRNTRLQALSSPTPSSSDDEASKSPASKSVQVTPSSSKRTHRNVKLVLDPIETNIMPDVTTKYRKDPASPLKDSSSPKKNESTQQDESPSPVKKDKHTSQVHDLSLKGHSSPKERFNSSPQKVSLPAKKDISPKITTSEREGSCSPKEVSSQVEDLSHSPLKDMGSQAKDLPNCSSKEVDSQTKDLPHCSLKEVGSQGKELPLSSPKEVGSKEINFDVLDNQSKTINRTVEEGHVADHSQNRTKDAVVSQTFPQEEEDLHLQLDDSYGEIVPLNDQGKEKEEEDDIQVAWESSEDKDKPEQVTSQTLPSQVIPSAEIKESSSENHSTQISSALSPIITSTKQKAVESQDIPAAFAPAPRVTRTKQRALDAQDAPPPSGSEPELSLAPAPRVRRTKQKVAKVQEVGDASSTDSFSNPPSSPTPAPRVTRTKQRVAGIPDAQDSTDSHPKPASPSPPRVTYPKQEAVKTQEITLLQENFSQPPSAPATRMTRTKQKANEVQEAQASVTQPATRVTRTKQKAREELQTLSRNIDPEDEEERQDGEDKGLKSNGVKDSGIYSLGIRTEDRGSTEFGPSEGSCAPPVHNSSPPRRITRSKMSKLQQAQQSPKALPNMLNFQRACCSPRGTGDSPASRKLAVQSGKDGVEHHTSKISHSPLRVIRHSPDKTGKVVDARMQMISGSAGRITPSLVSRMQPFLTASSSSTSSSSTEHKRIIKRTVGTPIESRRPLNIVTGITSFIKSQPARPTREEVEENRLQELQRKKEREEDTLRKKEQLLRAKAEEQKRRNEERMRRVQETRQEREQRAVAAKEKQERERRQREEEEQQRRRLLAKKKAEEEAKKAARLKEQQEERKRLEDEKKQKLEEERRRQRCQEEEDKIRYYEQKKKLEEQMKKKMAMTQMLKKKLEVEQLKPKEALSVYKENDQQALKQQEVKSVMSTYKEHGALNATYTSTKENSGGPLNTTYTKPLADARVDSYEMTPVQPKRVSSSLNDYNIDDIQSEDSTDDDASPKKKVPQWAMKTQTLAAILQQEHYPPQLDQIFPPESLLIVPDLTQMFPKQKRRFRKRTSSAQWETPPSKVFRVNCT